MRKLTVLLFFSLAISQVNGQAFLSLDSLRAYINKYIRNSAVESFTNLRLNRTLNGVVDFLGTTNLSSNIFNNSVGNGIAVAKSGTRDIKSMTAGYGVLVDSSVLNQVNYRADSSRLFADFRATMTRKVDTLFKVNDTLIKGLINGDTFSIVIKGIAGIGNMKAGQGYQLAYPLSDSIRSLRPGYGILMDTATVGEVKIANDTATIYGWSRANIRKVDTLYTQNDTTLIARIMGINYTLVIRGKSGAGNLSVGSGYKIAIPGTSNIKSLTSGFGVIIDSATANEVNVRVDTVNIYQQFRGIVNSSPAITNLTGDVIANGPGTAISRIENGVVTNSKLRNSLAVSVIGRSANTSGIPGDINAISNGQVLRRAADTLGFGSIDSTSVTGLHSEAYYNGKYSAINTTKNYIKTAGTGRPLQYIQADSVKIKSILAGANISITASTDSTLTLSATGITALSQDVVATSNGIATIQPNVVSNQKFRQSAAYAVVGNGTSATANVQDIIASTTGHVLRRSGTTLGFGTIDSTSAPDLHSEAYYNSKYSGVNTTKNFIKNTGIGYELGYLQVDTFKVKRIQSGANITISRNSDSSLTLAAATTAGITSLTGDVFSTGTPTAITTIGLNKVKDTMLRTSAAASVIGRSLATAGNVADISSSADGQVLRRSAGTLAFSLLDSTSVTGLHTQGYYDGRYAAINTTKNFIKNVGAGYELGYLQIDTFKIKKIQAGTLIGITRNSDSSLTINATGDGTGITALTTDITASGSGSVSAVINTAAVTTAKIADSAVTAVKFRKSAALSVVGNATNASASVTDIAAGTDGHVLKRSGTALAFGTLDSISVPTLRSQAYYDGRYAPINSTKNFIKNIGVGYELGYLQIDTFKVKRIQAGTGISITRNTDSSLTLASTITSGITSMTGDVSSTGSPLATTTIGLNKVKDTMLRTSAAASVIGRAPATAGNVADITATVDGQVLRRSGGTLAFAILDSTSVSGLRSEGYYNSKYTLVTGVDDRVKNIGNGTELSFNRNDSVIIKRIQAAGLSSITRNSDSSITINTTGDGTGITSLSNDIVANGPGAATATIQPNKVDNTKFRQSAGLSVVGNSGSTLANVADITAATDFHVLRRSGASLGFGFLDSNSVTGLHTEGYFNGKYLGINNVKNYIKNAGTTGYAQSYQNNDTTRITRLVAGSNITLTRNTDSSLTINSTGTAQTITLSGDVAGSGTTSITTAIGLNKVKDTMLRTSAAYSVIGRALGTAGNVADISTATNGHALRLSGGSLGFGFLDSTSVTGLHSEAYYNTKYDALNSTKNYIKNGGAGYELTYLNNDTVRVKRLQAGNGVTIARNVVDSSLTISATAQPVTITLGQDLSGTATTPNILNAQIVAGSVSDGKLRTSSAWSVIGRSANNGGSVADITATTAGQVLRVSGSTLGFGTLDSVSVNGLHSEEYYNGKYAKVGGATTQVQYNNSGVLAGSSAFTYDNTNVRLTLTGNTPTQLFKDTALAGRYTNVQSRRVVVNDTVNTADNGYVFQVYKDSTNRALFTNGNIAMHGTQRGSVSDSLFIVKGVDSILRQTAVKTINGVSIMGSGNIVTSASAGAAGGNNLEMQYNSSGTLAGSSNITMPVNPANASARDIKFTDGSILYNMGATNSWNLDFPNSTPDYHLVVNTANGKVYYKEDINRQGSYTPTINAGINISTAPTASTFYFSRNGNQVTVWGAVTVQTNAINTSTDIFISLPPVTGCAQPFSFAQQLVGTGSTQYNNTVCTIIGQVNGASLSGTANMKWTSPNISPNTSRVYYIQFTYYLTEFCG